MQETSAPRYTHDCTRCRFLGQHGKFDLYFCDSDFGSTVIGRHASDGPEYSSGMAFSYGAIEELTEARRRAQRQGLSAYNLTEALHATPPDAAADVHEELKQELGQSELGLALQLLLRDTGAGTQALRCYVDRQTRAYQAKFPEVDRRELKSWAQRPVLNAFDWLGRLGAERPSQELLTKALFFPA